MIDLNRHKNLIFIAILVVSVFSSAAFAEVSYINPSKGRNKVRLSRTPKYAEGELLVKFKPGILQERITAINSDAGVKDVRVIPKIGLHRLITNLKANKNKTTKELLELYRKDPSVEYAEPNYIVTVEANPNDANYALLWGLNNTGQTGGVVDADIDAPEAWDYLYGSWGDVVVAVIDTGVDYNHPDLVGNMWVNPGEIPNDGIDNDGNGYIDDYRGWDFCNNDNNPYDDNGHGTHVAGTIAAMGYNSIGVIGVNYKAKIMPVKFLSASGSGYTSDAVEAILYASRMGAKVMSNSWGGVGYSLAEIDAINMAYANGNGALFVAAAGNNSSDNDLSPFYPASCEVPNVVSVAATDKNDAMAWFSCYGFTSVDLAAPGVDIYSTKPNSAYQYLSGTSMATPHVSGAAALVMAAYPYLTIDEVKNLLLNSADPIASLKDKMATGGRLNARKALNIYDKQLKIYVSSPRPTFIYKGAAALIEAAISAGPSSISGASVSVAFSNGQSPVTLYDDGTHGDGAMNDGVYANYWTPTTLGSCDLTFSASEGGFIAGSRTINVTVIERVNYAYRDFETYSWVDATRGTALTLGDDDYEEIPIGFNFKFFGLDRSTVKVGSNGYLTFGAYASYFINEPIPSQLQPNDIIAPFWDDFNPSQAGKVYYIVTGTAPNRALTIEWYQVPHYLNIGAATFEVTLYESSNDMLFQYQDVFFEDINYDAGRNATIGIEGPDGLYGTQYSYGTASVYNFKAIRFFAINKGSISGKVLLQGRTNQSSPVTFELRDPGETAPISVYQTTSAADGTYTLTDIYPGTYDLTAKTPTCLKGKQSSVTVTSGQATTNINFSLLGGDANNDNSVGTGDMIILKNAWLSSAGQPRWDARADFNADGSIGTSDMLIMQSNWLKSGAQ